MHSITEPPLSRAAFETALLEAIAAFRWEDTRFHRMLESGRCPKVLMLRYARSVYLSAKLFCASLAGLVEKAPDRAARLTLLENLLEEEGISMRADSGLMRRPEARHPALALRFLEACGGREEDEAGRDGDGLNASGGGREMLAQGRWLEAAAFLLVGQELKFSHVAGCLFDLLQRNGMDKRDLAFFAIHVEADCGHGREALDLVIDRALTRREQEACIVAAEAGARSWFMMHGGAAHDRRAA